MFAMVQAAALKVGTSAYLAVSSVGSTTSGGAGTLARSGGSGGFSFNVHPNKSLPGTETGNQFLGGFATWGIYACLAAAIMGAALIAWGAGSHNPHKKWAGWAFLGGAFVGIMVLGGLNVFGSSALDAGSKIDAGS